MWSVFMSKCEYHKNVQYHGMNWKDLKCWPIRSFANQWLWSYSIYWVLSSMKGCRTSEFTTGEALVISRPLYTIEQIRSQW